MTQKTTKIINAPSGEAVYAASLMLHKLPEWRQALKPLFDAAARDIKAQEKIALHVPKALDEFGKYCQTLGSEIKAAQVVDKGYLYRPTLSPAGQGAMISGHRLVQAVPQRAG